jgi:hypothetical protein
VSGIAEVTPLGLADPAHLGLAAHPQPAGAVEHPQTPSPARGPSVGAFVVRHAADVGRAGFCFTTDEMIPCYPKPAVDAPFPKDDWGIGTAVAGLRMFWWAHRPRSRRSSPAPWSSS